MIRATLPLLLAFAGAVQAQGLPPCLPAVDTATHVAGPMRSGATKNGAWVRWTCTTKVAPLIETTVFYVGTVPELSKVGARVQTIINAAEPLASLRTAGARFTILPLSDPSLASIVADMRAAK